MDRIAEDYLKLLEDKYLGMQKIKSITDIMLELIDKENIEGLSDNVKLRGDQMEQIDLINEQLGKIESYYLNGKENGQNIKDKLIILLKDIIAKDMLLKKKIELLKDRLKNQIKNVNDNKKGIDGYGNINYDYESVYFDKQN